MELPYLVNGEDPSFLCSCCITCLCVTLLSCCVAADIGLLGAEMSNHNQMCDRWARLQETTQWLGQQWGELQSLRNRVQRMETSKRRRTPSHCRKRLLSGAAPLRDRCRLR